MPQAPRISPSMRRNVSHLAYLACFVRWQTILTLPSQPRGGSVGHDGERPLQCCLQVPRWRWQDSPAVWMVVWHCQGLVDFFSFCFLVIISCVYSIWKSPFLLLFPFWIISWAAFCVFRVIYVERISFSTAFLCPSFLGTDLTCNNFFSHVSGNELQRQPYYCLMLR